MLNIGGGGKNPVVHQVFQRKAICKILQIKPCMHINITAYYTGSQTTTRLEQFKAIRILIVYSVKTTGHTH